ncbi:gamma-aminobutyric acid type B receptor subunit 2-like isoform X2 [Actinia tenebrosa]|uniref:Gamma-aminobutyric acid type B receptor subunit 2 n=1 Tax=Actinia tenebrosa TaxID=6105 RepID=A0A6P8HP13_ACTTE|nr:gamma-aminobutyric acid type B receptor subunit 2-like isoform X2 [Actinia tenebrosa]
MTIKLHIGAFLSMSFEDSGWLAAGSLPGIHIAFEDINNSTDILKGYELKLVLKDTRCNKGYAFYQFVKLIQDNPQMVMILGGDCSLSTKSIAEASPHWNLVEVSYVASSSLLSDKNTFPLFLRTNQPEHAGNFPRISLMKMFGWSRIATIQSSELVFASTVNHFHELLSLNNFTRLTTEAFVDDAKQQISKIKEEDARIIYGMFYENQARLVLCEAYRQGIYGSEYLWFLPGWFSIDWWTKVEESVPCTPAQIKKAAGNYLSTIEGLISKNSRQILPTGKTIGDVRDRYEKAINQSAYEYDMYYASGYDAVLAMALALNKSVGILQAQGKGIENFTYNDNETAGLLKSILYSLSFNGMTGLVSFDGHGDRVGAQYILQFQDDKMVTLGYYDAHQDKIVLYSNESFYWPDGHPPKDRVVIQYKLVVVNFGLFVFVVVLSCIGALVTVMFLIFNVHYRNERFVKMSSPRLNVLILLGCCLVYLVVPLHGIDSSMVFQYYLDIVCQIEVWLMCIGFTMSYGTLFARTWRIHVIFTLTTTERKAIKDRHLFAIVSILLVIDIIVLSTWQHLDPIHSVPWYIAKAYDGLTHSRSYVEVCSSNDISIWGGILICYKGVLLLFGAFLAWETRNVSYSELNDSRNIAISVYTILVSSLVGIPVLIFVKEYPDFTFCIASFFVLISTSLIIALMFLPKVIALKKVSPPGPDNPKGCSVVTYRSSQIFLNPSYLQPRLYGTSIKPEKKEESTERQKSEST